MNRSTQPDIHPDADSLNAFVERVLAEPEHGRVLEHVAGCARCRDIVYLAQQMAEAEAPTVAQVQAGPRRGWLSPLFAGWQVAWIPAAALAAVAGVLIWVHLHSGQPAVDMARVAPPGVPAAARSSATTAGVAALAPSETAAHRPQGDNTAHSVGTPRPPAAAVPTPGVRAVQKNAPNEFQIQGNEVRMAPPAHPDLSAPAAIQSEPPLANTQWQPGQQVQISADRPTSAKSVQAPAAPNMIAVHGGLMAPPTAGPKPLAAAGQQDASQYAMMPQPVDGLAALRLTKRLKLPSGLNAVSSAATLNRLLAVDSAGTLFLSGDAGKHWDTVPVQWTGKVMGVSAQPRTLAAPADSPETAATSIAVAPSPQPADAQSAAVQPANIKAPPPAPAVVFRLVNDQHRAWISTDGRTWHEQPQ